MNDSYNIDTIYKYSTDNNIKELYSIEIFQYDRKINPYKGLLFSGTDERYFNTNNIIKKYLIQLHDSLNTKDSIFYNYSYEKDYLIKYFNDKIYESDSIVQNYFYD